MALGSREPKPKASRRALGVVTVLTTKDVASAQLYSAAVKDSFCSVHTLLSIRVHLNRAATCGYPANSS